MIIKSFLIGLGILSILYGIVVLKDRAGGRTFGLIWEIIGAVFLAWAYAIHKGWFRERIEAKIILAVFVIIAMLVLCTLTAKVMGAFHLNGQQGLDYIIVLGARVREDGPSRVLKYRLDKAIAYLEQNPHTMCIVSGGKGEDEPFSEAEGMYQYLLEQGIGAERVLVEDSSKNTYENIRNSKALLKESYNGVGIVTNNFHCYRALKIAKRQSLKNVCGIAAASTPFFLPNNLLRECMGIVKDCLKRNT